MFPEELVNHVKSTTNASYFVNDKGEWRAKAAEGFKEVTREEILGEKTGKKKKETAKEKAEREEAELAAQIAAEEANKDKE